MAKQNVTNTELDLNAANSGDVLTADGAGGATFQAPGGGSSAPAGGIMMFGGSSAPSGWLLCDGSGVSTTTYADLFSAIGYTYGGSGGTFNLPDMRQRFPLGKAASGTGDTLGDTGGAIDHTHSVPAHYHAMGSGADLSIGSSGSHTHTINHDHGSFTSGGSGTLSTTSDAHTHTWSDTSSSAGDHYHLTVRDGVATTGNSSAITSSAHDGIVRTYDGAGGVYAYDLRTFDTTPNVARTNTTGAHTHSVSGTTSSDSHSHTISSHTHSIDVPNFSGSSGSSSHTHGSGDFSGRIGLVSGGVDGNAAMTTGTQNPPFLVVNYIIKT